MFTLTTTRLQCNLLLRRCSVLHHAASQASRFTSSTSRTKDTPPPCASLSFHHNASVAVIRLNNPTRRNALTVSMMEDLDRIVQTLAKWSSDTEYSSSSIQSSDIPDEGTTTNARVVVLTGSNDTFCSGLDLHDNESNSGEQHSLKEGRNMLRHMTRVTNQLLSLPVLSVSAISGYAVGGGAELTTCTDLVVMSRDAQVKFVHVKRGASPGWGGGRRLVKKVGRQKALRMLLLGETVTGEQEATSAGVYADAVANEGESAYDATMRLIVEPILELPCSKSIRAIKKAVSAADGDGDVIDFVSGMLKLDTDLAVRGEMESFMSVWGGESNRNQIQKARERLKEKSAE